MTPDKGNICEIFSSFQGEGPYAGVRQIFVRTGLCHLRCSYCDTPESWERPAECLVETEPGTRRCAAEPNPLPLDRVLEIAQAHAAKWNPHSVSVTGGEPLLQAGFVGPLLGELRGAGLATYLETSGTLSDRLEKIVEHVDIVALDLKLPSCAGVTVDREDAKRCVQIARAAEVFVKVVILDDSVAAEVEDAARIVAEVDPAIPLILQPATPVHADIAAPTPGSIALFREAAERHLQDVTVVPQLHRIAGWK